MMVSARSLVARLGDPSVSEDEHYEARNILRLRTDREALEVLVASLDDARVFDPEYAQYQASTSKGPSVSVGMMCLILVRERLLGTMVGGPNKEELVTWWKEHRHLPVDEMQRLARQAFPTDIPVGEREH